MKISIITATYNSAATVRDTLLSVSGQHHTDVEHIVVDGASTDSTLAIVGDFPHVARLISEKDKGIYDAMNKGIAAATGEVIGILNSDDVYIDGSVLSEVAAAFADPAVMTVYADLQYVDAANLQRVKRSWRSGPFKRKNFYYGWMPPHPTFFVRRAVYEQAGLFNLTLRSAADYELMLRVLLKWKMPAYYIPRFIVKMRAGGMSNASLVNRLRANKEDRLAWKMNQLKPFFFTLYMKPFRKITQFFIR
ncbi:glycosyltransferase family 2 protein [Puia dinghuensis]|uniref:Glycosyl transferase n=1 Tax=Puia dinghuensis TaxID=1792502 RepID=A0A8J2XU35_9BACT|nr:glycosyltransferase family 2 protein [Puia dinghuensis]GGB08410.1 glycosyl transferase [Puia dinghuensis]